MAWRGVVRRGEVWRGVAWPCVAWRGVAWRGLVWRVVGGPEKSALEESDSVKRAFSKAGVSHQRKRSLSWEAP